MANRHDINLHVPFHDDNSFFCVEYPALVRNHEKMLTTLGNISHVKEVYNDTSKRLDLKFRPRDPCCKPACADRHSCTAVLVKITKYRRRSTSANKSDAVKYKQSICGTIDYVYKFSTMCDYQYLPIKRDDSGELLSMLPYLCVESLHRDKDNFTREAPLFVPPPTFSRLDTPQDYLYRDAVHVYKNLSATGASIGVARPRRFHNALCIKFEEDVPLKPLPGAEENFKLLCGHLGHKRDELTKLFQEQPVWSKTAVLHKLSLPGDSLKYVLPLVSYYCMTGPWRSLWIRLGYNPKTDPDARKYQLIDFRLRQGLHTPHIPIKAKRSTYGYKLPNLLLKVKDPSSDKAVLAAVRHESSPNDVTADKAGGKLGESGESFDKEATYVFRPGRLPAYRQMFYMACNILLPEAQALIQQGAPGENVCTKENGWFKPDTAARVRDVISKEVKRTVLQLQVSSTEDEKSKQKSRSRKRRKGSAKTPRDSGKDNGTDSFVESDNMEEENSALSEDILSDDEQESSVSRHEDDIDILISDDEDEFDKEDPNEISNAEWFDDEDFDEESQALGAASLFADVDDDVAGE